MFGLQPQRPLNQRGTVFTQWPQSLNPRRNKAHLCLCASLRSLPSCGELAVTDYSPLARGAVQNHKVVGGESELQRKLQHTGLDLQSNIVKLPLVDIGWLVTEVMFCVFIPKNQHFCPYMLCNGFCDKKKAFYGCRQMFWHYYHATTNKQSTKKVTTSTILVELFPHCSTLDTDSQWPSSPFAGT